jgi:hypothetical protein
MGRVLSRDLAEAEDLLEHVRSWSEEEVNELPKLYRKKAREYRELSHQGEG